VIVAELATVTDLSAIMTPATLRVMDVYVRKISQTSGFAERS
jgi:hypothetical protein